MSEDNENQNVYITSDNKTAVAGSASGTSILTFATATLTGGEEGKTYSCTANLSVTSTGTLDDALQAGEAFISFKDSVTGLTGTPSGEQDLFSADITNKQINFSFEKGTTDKIDIIGSVYVKNTSSQQNSSDHNLAGKQLQVQVTVDSLKCARNGD